MRVLEGGLEAMPFDLVLADLARVADLCFGPCRHGLRVLGDPPGGPDGSLDCCLRIEARSAQGVREPERDLELEVFRSGLDLHLLLSRVADDETPLLWHGSHPVWMRASSGERCPRPEDGAPWEAFCRRVRALLVGL